MTSIEWWVRGVDGQRRWERCSVVAALTEVGIIPKLSLGTLDELPRRNFERLLRGFADGDAEWLGYLEDDVVLAPDFHRRMTHAESAMAGAGVVALFSNKAADMTALKTGLGWRREWPGDFCMTQGMLLHRDTVAGVLDYLPEWEAAHPQHRDAVDYLIGDWCRATKTRIHVVVPSMVQHRDGVSLLGNRWSRPRVSRSFVHAYGEVQ